MIRAILIDDEPHCLESLTLQLAKYCPEVEVAGQYLAAGAGLEAALSLEPDVVFLDINMPGLNGIEVAQQLIRQEIDIVFTTAHDEYAIKAIKLHAVDYLLKPIDIQELKTAVERVIRRVQERRLSPERLNNLILQLERLQSSFQKVTFPTADGYEILDVRTIIRCQSDGNYTKLYINPKRTLLISKNLKEVEDKLADFGFCRVHHSHLINLNEMTRFFKSDGGYIVLSDGSEVPVSRNRREGLLQYFSR